VTAIVPPRIVEQMPTVSAPVSPTELGPLLKHWRAVRGTSQLELASSAATTPRYVSFLETGRAQPSRAMIVRLARALDIPLRERNELLLAAGYAPLYRREPLTSPLLGQVDRAISAMLAHHEPFPAVVMDRGWNLLRANRGAQHLFGQLFAPEPVPANANVLRLFVEPGRVRERLVNWTEVTPALLERATREAVERVLDAATSALVADLRARPDVDEVLARDRPPLPSPVIDVHFDVGGLELAFFSVVSTIGSPVDVTAQELKVESFFPSDLETSERWRQLAASAP
jgi:transcriptional regulator with XRE-family HTH domain